jgi:hypothetical protein
MTTFLARLPKARPARFERVRCNLARHIWARHRYGLKLCLALVPNNHPWSVMVRSANEDLTELTDTTLWPRNPATGKPDVDLRLRHGRSMWRSLWITALVVFLTLDVMSRKIPGPLGPLTGADEAIRIFDRLQAALSAFVGA